MSTKQISKNKKSQKSSNLDRTADLAINNLFRSIDSRCTGYITPKQFWKEMAKGGILKTDPRLQKVNDELEGLNNAAGQEHKIYLDEFKRIIGHYIIVKKCLTSDMAIPDFNSLSKKIVDIYKLI